jgi:hypothetical protein
MYSFCSSHVCNIDAFCFGKFIIIRLHYTCIRFYFHDKYIVPRNVHRNYQDGTLFLFDDFMHFSKASVTDESRVPTTGRSCAGLSGTNLLHATSGDPGHCDDHQYWSTVAGNSGVPHFLGDDTDAGCGDVPGSSSGDLKSALSVLMQSVAERKKVENRCGKRFKDNAAKSKKNTKKRTVAMKTTKVEQRLLPNASVPVPKANTKEVKKVVEEYRQSQVYMRNATDIECLSYYRVDENGVRHPMLHHKYYHPDLKRVVFCRQDGTFEELGADFQPNGQLALLSNPSHDT